MKIAVVGVGGVGGYLGARLASAGAEVTFVARGAQLSAMRKDGLRLVSSLGNVHVPTPNATDRLMEVDPVDFLFLGVKMWDMDEVAKGLLNLVKDGGAVISFQNGVEKDRVLARHLPHEAIAGGVAFIAAAIAEPGVIVHSGAMQRFVVGEYSGGHSNRLESLVQVLQKVGVDAHISRSIERLIWEKFVFLVGLSGTTASMRQPIGPIRSNPQTRAFLLDVMREVVTVGRASGVALVEDYAQDRLDFCDTLPEDMISSMLGDLQHGRRLELPWLSGAVVEIASSLAIRAPLNRAISDILAPYVNARQ